MIHKSTPAGWMVVSVIAALLAGYFIPQTSVGDEIDARLQDQTKAIALVMQKTETPNGFMGVDECLRCHLGKLTESKETPPLFKGFTSSADQWIRFDEIEIWSTQDKHSQAFSVLLGKQSEKMGRLLGVQEIHRDKRCLACHSSYPLQEMQTDAAGLVNQKLTLDRKVTLGVSCEGCHGSAGGDDGWYQPHLKPEWRTQSAELKEKEYGYYRIHSPVARAELCASCHIGNVKQGRIITHEMYAAGHPPLGAFEIESYLDQMPPHWTRFESKDENLRDEYIKQTGLKFDPDELHRTKSLLLGAVVSFRESMKLTADLADNTVNAPIEKPHWPELSQFACFACHHDLKVNGWRQNRSLAVTPGRPVLHEWPSALLHVAVGQSRGKLEDFQKHHAAVTNEFSERPFGTQSEFNDPLREFISLMDKVAEDLAETKLDSAAGLQILTQLVERGSTSKRTLDYDAARQIAWALRVVFDECKSSAKQISANEKAQIEDIVKLLENHLTLTFSWKQEKKKLTRMFPKESALREYDEIPLDQTLPRIADYDPLAVRRHFADIRILLQKQ
jgi:hypothetical protein